MQMKNIFFLLILVGILISCNQSNQRKLKIDTRDVDIPDVEIKRYEQALFGISPDSLKPGLIAIQADFPVFLGADLDDTLNIIQLHQFVTDPLNQKLFDSVNAEFPNLEFLETGLTAGFKQFHYYFPEKSIPDVFSYVSGLLYELPVQFFKGDMIIALDMYLGELEEYRRMRIPLYQVEKMNRDYLVRDAMFELYFYHFTVKPGKDFLQMMINKGKHLYFLDAVIPETPDHIKIGYPEEKLQWCFDNEENIWSFIIENELLYDSDAGINRTFFIDGPFTSDFSSDSPARIGEWIGWQVVRAYMNSNPEITPEQLFQEQDAQKILSQSGYKPTK
jgi:hypothetical protein